MVMRDKYGKVLVTPTTRVTVQKAEEEKKKASSTVSRSDARNIVKNPVQYMESKGITPEVIEESKKAPSPIVDKISYAKDVVESKPSIVKPDFSQTRQEYENQQKITPDFSQTKQEYDSANYQQQQFIGNLTKVKNDFYKPFNAPYIPNVIPSGEYYKKNDQMFYISPELKYVVTHSEPFEGSNLLSSFGGTPSFFNTNFSKAYESLTHKEKVEYGYTYAPFKDEPLKEWKYHPGGKEYLEKNKDTYVEEYIKSLGGYKDFGKNLSSEDLISLSRKYAITSGAWGDVKPTDQKFIKEYTWDLLSLTSQQQKEKYFKNLPAPARWYSSGFHAAVTAASFPITLPQMGVKLVTGSGDFFDRIESGKTLFLPDIGKTLERHQPGGPRGIITVGIGTGISYLVGRESDEFEKFMKDPVSGAFATGGELFGMLIGGKIASDIKVTGMKGLGYFRSAVGKYGVNLPSYAQTSYWFPTRMFRRWWIQRGTTNIDDIIGTPYHSTDTLAKGGLSFAEGSTPAQRITWTIGKTKETWDFPLTKDSYLLGSASGERIGSTFIIDPKILHELPALSTTPYGFAPTRFYRFGANLNYTSSFSILPKLHLPSAFSIPIKRLYKGVGSSYDDIISWSSKQPKGSWGVVSPKMYLGGPEAEINIFGKTILKRYLPSGSKNIWNRFRGYEYFTDVPLGEVGYLTGKPLIEKVPVVFTKPIHSGFPLSGSLLLDENIGSKSILSSFKSNFLGSSYNIPSIPLINPSYIFSSALHSLSIPGSSNIFSYSPPSLPSIIGIPSYSSSYSKASSYISSGSSIVGSGYSPPSFPSSIGIPSYSSSYSKASSYISGDSSYLGSGSSIVGSSYSPPPPSSYTPPPPSYISKPFSSITPPPPPIYKWTVFPPIIPSGEKPGSSSKQGFDVMVKDRYIIKGKKRLKEQYKKMNKNPLLKEDALAMGATITDNSAAKSFMIKPVEGKTSEPNINIINWGRMKHQFYTRKNREKKTVYTEKRAYGINTLGELEGITAKGWLSQQRRAFQPFKTLKTKKVGFNMDMRDMMNNQNKMMEKMLKGGIR